GPLPAHPRDPVTVQAGAVDQVAGLHVPRRALDHQPAAVGVDGGDLRPQEDFAVALADAFGQPPADLAVVDDAGLGDVERPDPGGVRLQLAQPGLVDHLAGDP